MAWTDESKATAVEKYLAAEPTPENSMEIVKTIADEMGESANGVRMILSQADVYVKKTPAKTAPTAKSTTGGDKAPRVSKEDSQKALTDAIEAAGADADGEIISKLTGKAAQYFVTVLAKITSATDDED
jgi:hypothetical protein